jgi:phage FluMu gp28-like protein
MRKIRTTKKTATLPAPKPALTLCHIQHEFLLRNDAAYFARHVLGITPDDKQTRILRSRAPQVILNCSRQWGKSTISGILALHQALFTPRSLVLVVSPTLRQSGELLRKIISYLPQVGIRKRGDGVNALSILLPNGSRIVGLPGKDGTIRGFSGTKLLIIDEASQVADSLYRSVRPFLAASTNGRIVMVSTPYGTRGFFWEEWERGENWERLQTPATECARIKPTFLERERRSMGESWFKQEYLCQFLENENTYLPRAWVEAAFTDVHPQAANSQLCKNEFFIGLDLGRRHDHSALVVLERSVRAVNTRYVDAYTKWETALTVRQVKQWKLGTPYGTVAEDVARLHAQVQTQGPTTLVIDQTGVGDAVYEMIRAQLKGAKFEGVTITQDLKRDMYAAVETGLEQTTLKVAATGSAADALKQELLTVEIRRVGQGYKYGAFDKDAHDDLVMALALACWRERMGKSNFTPTQRLPGF